MTPFIVAEVSKNWVNGYEVEPGLLAERFEEVIEVNRQRGYRLHSFQLHRVMVAQRQLNETIVAVFELKTVDSRPLSTTGCDGSATCACEACSYQRTAERQEIT